MTTADLIFKISQLVIALAVFAAAFGLILFLIDRAPKRGRDVVQLLAFLLPALILLGVGLIYPAIRTTVLAFGDSDGDFIGVDNFIWAFTQPAGLISLRNTVIWVVLVPAIS